MLPVLAYPVVVVGLALSVMIGGMGMANIENYRSQIEQKQSETEQDLEEKIDDWEIFEDAYIKQSIDEWEEDEVIQDDISEFSSMALDDYCFNQDIDLTNKEFNYIKKKLPQHITEVIERTNNGKSNLALWYYIQWKTGRGLEWMDIAK